MKKMRQRQSMRLDIVVTDKDGKVVDTRHVESDIYLRNYLCNVKLRVYYEALVAGDNRRDVLNNSLLGNYTGKPYMMLGSGSTAETSADYRIQTPLYTQPDPCTVGIVNPGAGTQVVLPIVSAHTFAAQTDVYEAGILNAQGSATVYLSAGNVQLTRNVFAKVTVPAGGTFTATFTPTVN